MAKFVYVDEAGTDIGAPATVVAGVIIDPDSQWPAALQRIETLRTMLPEELRSGFVFHATEIYSGGKQIPRKKYGKEIRFPVLEALLQSLKLLQLPIFFACLFKDKRYPDWNPQHEMFFRHSTVFLQALKEANRAMRGLYPGQRATVTAEDVPHMRQWLVQLPSMLREASAPQFFTGPHPFDTILDTPNFVKKDGAPILQFADAVAFAFRHYLSGHKDGEWVLRHLFGKDDVKSIMASVTNDVAAQGSFLWIEKTAPP